LMDDECVIQLDDDLVAFYNLSEVRKVYPENVWAVLYETFLSTVELGAEFFCWESQSDAKMYSEFSPFAITGYICGSAFGVIKGSRVRHDEMFNLKLDYDLSLMNAYVNKLVWKNQIYAFYQKRTFRATGGLSKFRTLTLEKEEIKRLKQKYGSNVIKEKGKRGGANRNIVGDIGIFLNLPF
ncbi:MAG: hypothetical protein AB1472_06255, partial [Candidatus Omnitrophota bacterium]